MELAVPILRGDKGMYKARGFLARTVHKVVREFLVLYGQILCGEFLSLRQTTQEQIKKAFSRMCNDLARVLGRKNLTYSQFVELAHEYHDAGKMPLSLAQGIAASVFPDHIKPNEAPGLEFLIDQEKLDVAMANSPEPSPEALEGYLKMLNDAVPAFRRWLLEQAKELPHGHGGAPRKLKSAADQARIVEEIKALRGPGKKLEDVFKRVAQRHCVSASKIKQIWLRAKKESASPDSI